MSLFSKDVQTFDDLFLHSLRDIYYAENEITSALPKMIDKASNPKLKKGFETHLTETQNQIGRLDRVLRCWDSHPKG